MARTLPWRIIRTWVKPGAISSTWWVTMSIEGAIGSRARRPRRRTRSSRPPRSRPHGGLVEEEQFGVGHQGAGDEGALALALGERAELALQEVAHAEAVEEGAGALFVDVLVVLVPAAWSCRRRRSARSAGRSGAWGACRPWRCRPCRCAGAVRRRRPARGCRRGWWRCRCWGRGSWTRH